LVKELRLAVVRTLAEGNALLPGFIPDYNAHFAKAPANKKDLHRPLHADDDLEDAFAWKEERALSKALTLQYDKILFILEPSETTNAAIGKRITVVDYPDGRLSIRYPGVELVYRTFDKLRQVDQGGDHRPQAAGRSIGDDPRSAAAARTRTSQRQGTASARSARRSTLQGRLSFSTSRACWRSLGKNDGCDCELRASGAGRRCATPRASRPPAPGPDHSEISKWQRVTSLNGGHI
jgi:hypothetical protein